MTWISMLKQTYDNSPQLQGVLEPGDDENSIPLLLVGQSTQNAHIEVLLNNEAKLQEARVILAKANRVTLIPCTEESIGRTGTKIAPHPLHDKLQYVAGDYRAYGGRKGEGFQAYLKQLNAWCASDFAHDKVKKVRDYLGKGTLIHDLIEKGVLPAENGRLIINPSAEQKKRFPAFKVLGDDPTEAFIRFAVHVTNEPNDALWRDNSVVDSFNRWQESVNTGKGLCYVTGREQRLAENHPAKIRNTGDKAKLISANDKSGFTYRGRFRDGSEAVGVSYEVSQKAHNMLKWLISRYGYRNDSQVFVAWGTRLQPLPGLGDDTQAFFDDETEEQPEAEAPLYQQLREDYSLRFRRAMAGYHSRIGDSDAIVVMGVDSATTGRLSIIFYRTLTGSDFLARIEAWHQQCAWLHTYKYVQKKPVPFIGAPSPRDMAAAAYGQGASDKLMKATVERLMHCIVDGKSIPTDIRCGLIRRAGNPPAMEGWEWRKTVSIACAVIRKHQAERKEEPTPMALERDNPDRSYLFGRLLAYAQHIEDYVQYRTENAHRQTNAERMMHAMTLRPAKTWTQLSLKLQSYLRQLHMPGLKARWNAKMQEIVDRLGTRGFTDEPLEEQYLLGFSSQMMEFRTAKSKNEEEDTDHDPVQE